MAAVPQKNSAQELLLRKELFRRGFRYRLHPVSLPGRPDIVFPKYRVAVFVNGCFWHRHKGCKLATMPSTRRDFWEAKFRANVERDVRKCMELRARGWYPVVVWQCQIDRSRAHAAGRVARLLTKKKRAGRPRELLRAK